MLSLANGNFESNPVLYINLQLRYYFNMSSQEIDDLTDDQWAEHYAVLENIRLQESKNNQPFQSR